jgi:hypothetical protein
LNHDGVKSKERHGFDKFQGEQAFWHQILLINQSDGTGDAVVASGRRRWIDTHWFRGNSYFRIGWEWVKAAWVKGWELTCAVRFVSHTDPDPAMASRKQDEKRRYRFEFQIQTIVYATE